MLLAALQSCLPAATRLGTGSGGHIRKQNAGAVKAALDPSLLLHPSSNSNKTFATAASADETATAAMSGLRSIKQVWSEKLCVLSIQRPARDAPRDSSAQHAWHAGLAHGMAAYRSCSLFG